MKKQTNIIRDKKTNKKCNPIVEFDKAINSDWYKKIMIRLKNDFDNYKENRWK
tara:strand:- start:1280 stop:1438 length:159 start_codon:yes stop_codon:yes gene_type:complete